MRHKQIIQHLHNWVNEKRIQHKQNSLKLHTLLSKLASNHSHKMSHEKRIWVFQKKSKIPLYIKNPVEATIASVLIVMGFLIAWVFLLFGFILKKYGRKGFMQKKIEFVAVASMKRGKGVIKDSERIAKILFTKLSKNKAYVGTITDSDFQLIGIGIRKRKHLFYITQILYG